MNSKFRMTLLTIVVALTMQPSAIQAKSSEDKVKESIDAAAASLKEAVDKAGNNMAALQEYLENYSWKGVLQDHATSGVATVSNVRLNDHSRVVAVKPGEKIKGEAIVTFDMPKCNSFDFYRIDLGIAGVGAQTTIGNVWGSAAGRTLEKFTLVAPNTPGFYQLRFRTVPAVLESTALASWLDQNGHEPDNSTTVGLIYVKQP